jgi:ribosomal protein S18 acetylase RimI-like enzyme
MWRKLFATERLIILHKALRSGAAPRHDAVLRTEEIEARHLPELRALNASRGQTADDARFARDLAAGYGGYVALLEDHVIGCIWWVDHAMRPLHYELTKRGAGLTLEERDIYFYDLVIAEAYRGRHYGAEFLGEVETLLADRGFDRLVCYVVSDNYPALRLYLGRGYQQVLSLRRTWVLGCSFTRVSSATQVAVRDVW